MMLKLCIATVEDIGAAFLVRDGNGQGLAYVYYEDETAAAREREIADKRPGEKVISLTFIN